ncbi:hypothetical protein J4558_17085 [Leptolyngbya sp. 15MV]|nr:hypothetical protein J4558_17085 [Leptolyngbya sp. 15MV]
MNRWTWRAGVAAAAIGMALAVPASTKPCRKRIGRSGQARGAGCATAAKGGTDAAISARRAMGMAFSSDPAAHARFTPSVQAFARLDRATAPP